MRRNVVVVADDDSRRSRETVKWLKSAGIEAYPQPDTPPKPIMTLIRELKPRIVLCRPGAAGIAMFYPLRNLEQPPTIVLLANGPDAKDQVYWDDGLIVAAVRTPVQLAALAKFISTALSITARLDDPGDGGKLLVHPSVERFIDPATRAARASRPRASGTG
ncbi:MAG TPA: hypothetical protein VJ890_03490 [Vineibacter sp.]|nr:hypothetical protein [Vineibacter sp.]